MLPRKYRGSKLRRRWCQCELLSHNHLLMSWHFADNYKKLCTIEADLSGVPLLPQPKGEGRGIFFGINYEIILLFGITELKVQVAWHENVSYLHMLFNAIDFGLILRVFLGNRETVSFKKKKLFSALNHSYLYTFTGVLPRLLMILITLEIVTNFFK